MSKDKPKDNGDKKLRPEKKAEIKRKMQDEYRKQQGKGKGNK